MNGIEGKGSVVIKKEKSIIYSLPEQSKSVQQAELMVPLNTELETLYDKWKNYLTYDKQRPVSSGQATELRRQFLRWGTELTKLRVDRAIAAGSFSVWEKPEDLKQPAKNSTGRPSAPPLF